MAPQAATVYLLVAVLLACPFPCLAQAAASVGGCAVGDCATTDACACPASESGNERSDDPCSDPSSNGTCLCHGAVMDRPAELPSPAAGIVSLLPLATMLLAGESFSTEDRHFTGQAACHFPSADSGREVRALIESLLL